MPEGPEVRKYADALHSVLSGRSITSFEARTRDAREWLKHNESKLIGRRVKRVVSHGKHLIGYIENDFYFHSHLMMGTLGNLRANQFEAKTEPDKQRASKRLKARAGCPCHFA